MEKENNKIQIRNSTAEFLIFSNQANENTIEVQVADETVWLSQKLIALLFEVEINTINYHIKEIYKANELQQLATIRKFRIVQTEGKREVKRDVEFYNLDMIISIGYKVNSQRAIQFRQWATKILRDFAIKGYVLDKQRLKNGAFLSKQYFDDLLAEIRASERNFYQKITDIYITALDYNKDATDTKTFFATVQNKLHFATHGNTAAEIIVNRANAEKDNMGLNSWKNAPIGKIIKTDVSIAKNYLNEKELKSLDRFVTMYLDYAEDQAERSIPMTMNEWADKLNVFFINQCLVAIIGVTNVIYIIIHQLILNQ